MRTSWRRLIENPARVEYGHNLTKGTVTIVDNMDVNGLA